MSFASRVFMVRPTNFRYNAETAIDNKFMSIDTQVQGSFVEEFDRFVEALRGYGVQVDVHENPDPEAPDAVFPNNWFSTHGLQDCTERTLVLYPMRHPSRQRERRPELVDWLKQHYDRVIDLSHYEASHKALEGTGSLVFDRKNSNVFMSISERADPAILHDLLTQLNSISHKPWNPVIFEAVDQEGTPIYHTNVIFGLTGNSAIVNLASIRTEEQRSQVLEALKGYSIIDISHLQTKAYCGNLMTLHSPVKQADFAVLSSSAQSQALPIDIEVLYVDIPTIERVGGGSARCMLAELY